ncbi:HAD family hydrolase [Desmospora profundinema]|uniref:Phosphoglycolate phosphatase-like HAD superfamily hydrolase n=1 Tax=Desmospora profundinema TaxID=1571184 RepID=A0ABU1IQD3_9BACL|nr:HAD hydrolase-like protein [Desmospora profundinema]MDR6226999.1 phosphoglycolate phosphatase-like HAD superfamily hydrolase [Desmospora profundinema]
MTNTTKPDLIFDMDGTLFQTEKVAVPAFHRTFRRLKEAGFSVREAPDERAIQAVFGLTLHDIWERLLPGTEKNVRETADSWWLEEELKGLEQGMGELYPGVEATLHRLHRNGHRLFIASNGLGPYIRGILQTFHLAPLFTAVYSAGEQGIGEKERLVEKLIKEHAVHHGVMIGDRSSDVRAGKMNNLWVVGCRYAGYPQFGRGDELDGADFILSSFEDLEGWLKEAAWR